MANSGTMLLSSALEVLAGIHCITTASIQLIAWPGILEIVTVKVKVILIMGLMLLERKNLMNWACMM